MRGARGPFPPAAAMVVVVVTPLVFCNKATEKCNKNNIISFLDSIFVCITTFCKTYCSLRNTNSKVDGAQVVALPEAFPIGNFRHPKIHRKHRKHTSEGGCYMASI